ncbi:MAG: hypothetical protein ACF8R9_03210 [Phycisphaerales bacterium JB054]
MSGRSPISPTATTILTGLLVAVVCAGAAAQDTASETDEEVRVEDMTVTPAEARFALTVIVPKDAEDAAPTDEQASGMSPQLEASPAGLIGPDEQDASDNDAVFTARAWVLHDPAIAEPATEQLDWTGAEVVQMAASPRERGRRITARTSGVFGVEAAQLTPLTGGKEMFSLEVAHGLTLAGVGSRRMWTERDRAFVLAAEAGWKLTHYAGLHVGYEVLQTPLGGAMPEDAGGDSIFARFQLRF